MEREIERALEDIGVIKRAMERTREDFTKIGGFFVGVGLLGIAYWLLEELAYYVRNVYGYSSSLFRGVSSGVLLFPLAAYAGGGFGLCHYRMKGRINGISRGMLNIWGIILVGSNLFFWLYKMMLPAVNNAVANTLSRASELLLVLPVIFGCLMTGILLENKGITIAALVLGGVYLGLFASMREIPYGRIGGVGTRIPMSNAAWKVMMTVGMLALGIYLKMRGNGSDGDTHDTGSLPD